MTRNLSASNPAFITDAHADAIVEQLFKVFADSAIPYATPGQYGPHIDERGLSRIALSVCDAVSADITLQPLHDAYGRAMQRRGLR